MTQLARLEARIQIRGAFECCDADGNVVKTIEFTGSKSLAELGLTEEQARQLTQEQANGMDHR